MREVNSETPEMHIYIKMECTVWTCTEEWAKLQGYTEEMYVNKNEMYIMHIKKNGVYLKDIPIKEVYSLTYRRIGCTSRIHRRIQYILWIYRKEWGVFHEYT